MKSFFAAALIGATQAAVHHFKAESNFICQMCQHAVSLANKGDMYELDQLYKLYPQLEEVFEAGHVNAEMIDTNKPEATCSLFGLCE